MLQLTRARFSAALLYIAAPACWFVLQWSAFATAISNRSLGYSVEAERACVLAAGVTAAALGLAFLRCRTQRLLVFSWNVMFLICYATASLVRF